MSGIALSASRGLKVTRGSIIVEHIRIEFR